jgi:hypothetical protein
MQSGTMSEFRGLDMNSVKAGRVQYAVLEMQADHFCAVAVMIVKQPRGPQRA